MKPGYKEIFERRKQLNISDRYWIEEVRHINDEPETILEFAQTQPGFESLKELPFGSEELKQVLGPASVMYGEWVQMFDKLGFQTREPILHVTFTYITDSGVLVMLGPDIKEGLTFIIWETLEEEVQ